MTKQNEKFIQKTKKFQPVLLMFACLIFVLSFALGFFVQKSFYNDSIVEVESGIKKHQMIEVNTKYEGELKEKIINLGKGYKQTTWFISILLGVLIGAVCFVSSMHLFFLWLAQKNFLDILEGGKSSSSSS